MWCDNRSNDSDGYKNLCAHDPYGCPCRDLPSPSALPSGIPALVRWPPMGTFNVGYIRTNIPTSMVFRVFFNNFSPFRPKHGLPEGWEVFKKLPGGGTIHSDRIWARGEPWRACSCRCLWIFTYVCLWKNLPKQKCPDGHNKKQTTLGE